MAFSTPEPDARLTDLYASLRSQWVRQTVKYSRSVRLFHERAGGRNRQRAGALQREVRLDEPVRDLVSLSPALRPMEPPVEATGRGGKMRSPLTARQREIADLIADGLTNAQIATQIMVSRGTVGNHIGHMLRRLGVKNRAQIAAWAIRHAGEVPAEDAEAGAAFG